MPDESESARVQRRGVAGAAIVLLLLSLTWGWRNFTCQSEPEPLTIDDITLKPENMTEAERATYLTPEPNEDAP